VREVTPNPSLECGPPPAWHLAREALNVIIRFTGQAPRRWRPLSSNVRPHVRSRFIKLVAFLGLAVLTVVVSPLLLVMFIGDAVRRVYLRTWWHLKHGRHGRNWLAVYSEGAKWKEHFESAVLPIVGNSAIVINTTKSPSWRHSRSLERLAHECWAGRVEHTPILIRFPGQLASVRCIRFHQAYLAQAKRGEPAELHSQLQQLRALAGEA
jgi:hypothetical protein